MAAKRVLGNDPFKRGAAPRVPAATKPVLTPMDATARRPVTPEVVTPPTKPLPPPPPVRPTKRVGGKPRGAEPIRHEQTPRATPLGPMPAAHANTPTVVADPVPHAAVPTGTELGRQPAPHAGSPRLSADPVAHDATPEAFTLGRAPARHSHSPFVVADPVAHAAAPQATTIQAVTPHAGSPAVVVDPVPHAGAPVASELDAVAVAHPHSPGVQADPVPHAAAPESVEPEPSPPAAGSLSERARRVELRPSLFSGDGVVASVKGVASALRTFLGRAGKDARVDAYGRDEGLVERLQPLADALYQRYWRVRVEGAERLPPGACVLVANHAGALPIDGPLLHHALKRERADLKPARWLLEDQVFYAPGVGVLWNRLGAVRASPENALQLLADDTPIIVFPEGLQGLAKPFGQRYHLQRFGRGGYVKIAARAGVPIVPVAIVGAEESVPLLGKLPGGLFGVEFLPVTLPPLPARWFIRFGAPVEVEGGAEAAGDLALVQRLNDQVRDTIDGLLKAMLAERSGVF
ncbi:MAG: 1-acyl-sn-glycerol-3-phosphate acyltransferase [Myxococcaceae bacterium]|nr:1-acyl-sn-glycerol-3-phosphate acyltransferase [Myxococcaceae bacterium]